LLPSLLEYLNDAMLESWSPGVRRNVSVSTVGVVPPETPGAPCPTTGPFSLAAILRDESFRDEIYFDDASELLRLFDWFDFLVERDGSAGLYRPLVDDLRSRTRGIEKFASL